MATRGPTSAVARKGDRSQRTASIRLTEAMIEKGPIVEMTERRRRGRKGSRDQRAMMPAVNGMLTA